MGKGFRVDGHSNNNQNSYNVQAINTEKVKPASTLCQICGRNNHIFRISSIGGFTLIKVKIIFSKPYHLWTCRILEDTGSP